MPFNHYFDIVQTHKMRLSSCFQSNYWIIELLGFLSSVPCCLLFIGKGECLDTLISPGAAWLWLLSTMLPPVYRKGWQGNSSWNKCKRTVHFAVMFVIERYKEIVCLVMTERMMKGQRYMCFFRRLQHHNTTTSFFTTHTHTHSLTH